MTHETWAVAAAYEAYVGRWSRLVAADFVRWLNVPAGRSWADVGCGTGALTAAVLARAEPAAVVGIDPSEGFIANARETIVDERVDFRVGDAQSLSLADQSCDVVISGLAINFVPDAERAAAEFRRITSPGGTVAAYVWDYAGGMAMMKHLWTAAADLDPGAADLDEGSRFPLCRPDPLRDLWVAAGLKDVAVDEIVVPTVFADFDDFWTPFLGGQGPAPGYVTSLTDEHRNELRELLRGRLRTEPDGSIPLSARAWAVRGSVSVT